MAEARVSTPFPWPEGYVSAAAFTFDVDGETAILGQHPDAISKLGVMSHQAYGPTTGVPRLLRILAKHEVRATFFVPGWIAHRYSDTVRAIVGAGHEIGHHGYLHEHVDVVDEATELSYLDRGSEALEEVAGVRPVGYRAPGAELNYRSPGLLARRGFRYDSTLMDADTPYVIDLPDEARLVEIPIQWALDDWEQYAFVPGYEGSGVIESPSKALEMWTLELEAMRDEGGCFVLVNHPLLSGRPSRARALEQLIERALSFDDVWVTTLGQIAEHVLSLELPGRQLSAPPVDRHRSPLTAP